MASRHPCEHDYREILESLTTAVMVLDGDLRLSYMNPAGEALLAASAGRHLGQPLRELLPDCAYLVSLIHKTLGSNRQCTEREMSLTLPDLSAITVDCTLTPYETDGVMVEMLPMDRHLRIAREEHLHAQFQATRELLRGLAHEVKNPLGGLRGAAQLLERELPSAELREYTRVIIDEADRLRKLVDGMLTPSHLPRLRPTNIHEIVERVRQLVEMETPAGILIVRDYDPSLPDVQADPDQLIQATLNLVRNAAQAIGERGTITLKTRALRQFTIGHTRHRLVLAIQVIDDGPGIAPEMIETIFYPMISGRAEGTGLGLTIAQTLINQHRGLIECASQPGCTVFTIYLPLDDRPRRPTP